jgi:hypothetical protein
LNSEFILMEREEEGVEIAPKGKFKPNNFMKEY